MADKVIEAVRADLLRRSEVGTKKYGVTLDKAGLSLRDWLQHAYEENLDAANYLKAAIMEIDAKAVLLPDSGRARLAKFVMDRFNGK